MRLSTLPRQVQTLSAQVTALQGDLTARRSDKAEPPRMEPSPASSSERPPAPAAAQERLDTGARTIPSSP